MRLVIDALGLQTQSRFRGIGRYVRGLTEGLARTAGDHEVWLALAANKTESFDDIRAHFAGLIPAERIVQYKVLDGVACCLTENDRRRKASELIKEHFLASLEPSAILFGSLFEGYTEDAIISLGSVSHDAVRAIVLYDLIPLLFPEEYLADQRLCEWYNDKVGSLRKGDLLLANSAFSGQSALDHLGIEDVRVVKIMGAADCFASCPSRNGGDFSGLAKRLGIDRPFFFYAASFEPRKNFATLIDAFSLFTLRSGKSHQLVLATSSDDRCRTALAKMTERGGLDATDVIVTGHITDQEMMLLYGRCAAFVFPSLFEGFGLPILEAMHCNAAVVGSNVSSIPEIIALDEAMFDPTSVEAIADMMLRSINDEEFVRRLKANSVYRRSLFTWEESAIRTWRALEETVRRSNRGGSGGRRSRSERYHELIDQLRALPPLGRDDSCSLANAIADNLDVLDGLRIGAHACKAPVWRIEGPFDSFYSLALLNRETARALQVAGEDVVLRSTEGPGDFPPDEAFLARFHPNVLEIYKAGTAVDLANRPVFVSRNLYPPRVSDMGGQLNFLHQYAWEESRFPGPWVDQFNLHLDGITCLSSHVLKILQDSGVIVPMRVSGCGVDHWERVEPSIGESFVGKAFRILHVSSCFPRKGADSLLTAFGKAFQRRDDVTLIIKTFPNPHNEIKTQLAAARETNPEYPDVVVIFDHLSDGRLKALYQWCHLFVAPSRAEGYGLPMAEAIMSGLPVITTGWGGQLDFCSDETAWLVDYEFAPARTHFELSDSVWAEPNTDHLAARMREVFEASKETRARKVACGRDLLMSRYKWEDIVGRMTDAVDAWSVPQAKKPPRLGWVTTWNCRCGIATYSAHFLANLPAQVAVLAASNDELNGPDAANIYRCWHKDTPGAPLDDLAAALDRLAIDTLVIQFNYGFFDLPILNGFLREQKSKGTTIIIVLHSTIDPIGHENKRLALLTDGLKACDRLLVHSYHDLNRLKALGLVENVALFPHGIVEGLPVDFKVPTTAGNFTIASYGFCLPHKGLLRLVYAFSLMAQEDPRLKLHLVNAEYPIDISKNLVAELRAEIAALKFGNRVLFTTNFLSDAESLAHLRSTDLVVFPYDQTAESASGAARLAIASGRPVATARLPIFADLDNVIFQFDAYEPSDIAAELTRLIAYLRAADAHVTRKSVSIGKWREEHSYELLATRLIGIIEALRGAQLHPDPH